jgi:hypothetical protein
MVEFQSEFTEMVDCDVFYPDDVLPRILKTIFRLSDGSL